MEQGSAGSRAWQGLKTALGIGVALPLIGLLLPLWYLHRWHERRTGRPEPEPPWREIWPRRKRVVVAPVPGGDPCRVRSRATTSARSAPLTSVPSVAGVALVTGGARRLGAEISRELASLGYRVAVLYLRSSSQAEALVAEIRAGGGEAAAFSLDQGDPQQIVRLLDEVEGHWGVPDLLVNNASLFEPTPVEGASWQGLERLCRVNCLGPMWLAWQAAERMKNRTDGRAPGGQIVQICDIWGERPLAGHGGYSVSKAGLIMATRVLAREMAPSVRVNGIAPGAILAREGESGFQTLLSRTPLARHAGPEAILVALRYLLNAPFVTGEILHVDGGRSLL
ncbi:MAG: SDR family NAD(P)-dependent oxidoreductase [Magnetococcus sp. MYC-9]